MAEHTIREVGGISVVAGDETQAEYDLNLPLNEKCVVVEFFADWTPETADEDIEMFLYGKRRHQMALPATNYYLSYGPPVGSGVTPAMNLFHVVHYRERWRSPQQDPVTIPIPMAVVGTPFEVKVRGTPFQVKRDFGIKFTVETRPFNP